MPLTLSSDLTVEAIARRLADPETVRSSRRQVRQTARFPTGWNPQSVAMGPLGSALVFEELTAASDSDADEWSLRADAILEECHDPVAAAAGEDASLFGGTPGAVLAYLSAARRDPRRWHARASALADEVAEQALSAELLPAVDDVADADYDIISGRAGVLMALTAIRSALPEVEAVGAAINRVFDDLHELLRRGELVGDGAMISPRHYPLPEYAEEFPLGYLNTGLAHGLPGVLLALSSVETAGGRDEKRRSLVKDLSARILDVADRDRFGLIWSTGIPRSTSSPGPRPRHRARAPHAWCYGAPGVALALHRAGASVREPALVAQAREIMRGALDRHPQPSEVLSPSICHGVAGILACADTVLGVCRDPESTHAALRRDLLERGDVDAPLLYRDVEEPAQELDDPSVIQGAAGIALVLAAGGGRAPRSPWRHLFGF
ncbi:Lanthionine synthetase C-like protein [Microbacterium testaceum StLB037]|uniref:Lanthionine synthetase C-like protein n=1 Tax=Microbacterium testaceum (strain StLB037) TaxID=979556 RepID=A0A1H0NIV7_MICTS|nr:lanthionine synthetase LanC family protein [Microbacterium testaceum]SDO92707.1 Lanthionine synthetase C-like protein [Microbacterium testaceum StLB037]